MRVDPDMQRIELSRRNLLTLLAKLGGYPPDSDCTIVRDGWAVVGVPDAAHYADRPPGAIHPDTEAVVDGL